MKNSLRRIKLLALALVLPLATVCIFDTRDAQPPEPVGGGGCTLETSEKAFECMAGALERRQDGDYDRSLSETFRFSPTLADSLAPDFDGLAIYDNWTKDVEMQVLGVMLSENQSITVDWGDVVPLINKNTFVRYRVTYSLEVVPATAPEDTVVYKGVAQIDVRNEGGNWRVTFWDEVETVENFSTWGYLRGITRKFS